MSVPVNIKINVTVGPATITYESGEGDELFHIEDSAFIQKVMDLMKYVGSPDNPPETPASKTPVLPMATVWQPPPAYGGDVPAQPPELDDLEDDEFYDSAIEAGSLPSGSRVARISGTSFAVGS